MYSHPKKTSFSVRHIKFSKSNDKIFLHVLFKSNALGYEEQENFIYDSVDI